MVMERDVTEDDAHALVPRGHERRERRVRLPAERALEVGEEDDRRGAVLHARGHREVVADDPGQIGAARERRRDEGHEEEASEHRATHGAGADRDSSA
jgi:hypothetical protein